MTKATGRGRANGGRRATLARDNDAEESMADVDIYQLQEEAFSRTGMHLLSGPKNQIMLMNWPRNFR